MRAALVSLALLGASACGSSEATAAPSDGRPEHAIEVTATGYTPSELRLPASSPVRLVFTRTSDEGCGQELAIPGREITRALPLGQPVAIDLTTPPTGRLRFTCGMGMYEGAIVVD